MKNVETIDLKLIRPNRLQPRLAFYEKPLQELADSIKENGLLQPILVRKGGDKYQIIAGERRWQACKSLDMKKVPVRVKEADDDQTIILALVVKVFPRSRKPERCSISWKPET